MANTLQLSDLITAVRQRADMVNSQFVTDTELTSYINQSYQELYDLLVQKYGDDYFVAPPVTFTTDGTSQLYPLPNGTLYSSAPAFQKLLGVDLQMSPGSAGSYVTIKPFMFAERNRYSTPNFQSFYGVTNMRYRLQGNNLWLTPVPAAGQTIQLWYIPQLSPLVNGTDTAPNLGGWLEYVIVDAAIKCMQKEESDCSVLMAQKSALILRIESASEGRDAGNPQTVSETRSADFWWPEGSSGNGGGY